MTTAHIEVAHVYKALAEILKNLSVEKNGTLPGNMGGKSYITAVDASAEVKRQFVANDLVFIPNEEVITNEHIVHKDRMNIRIVIRGEYTIVSTVDGSQVTVSGIGDGLATGTAVAANIGSTNALKNALLRTFLITEQSVEDESKNGAVDRPEAQTPAQRKLDQARKSAPAKPAKSNTGEVSARDQVRVNWIESGKLDADEEVAKKIVNGVMDKVKQENPDLKGDAVFQEVLNRLGKGEVG